MCKRRRESCRFRTAPISDHLSSFCCFPTTFRCRALEDNVGDVTVAALYLPGEADGNFRRDGKQSQAAYGQPVAVLPRRRRKSLPGPPFLAKVKSTLEWS